jgi:Phage integrase family
LRHTAATLLKDLGVPARDAQLILGHARISTTLEIYQHGNMQTRRSALGQVEALFLRTTSRPAPWQQAIENALPSKLPSTRWFVDEITSFFFGSGERTRTSDPRLMRSLLHDDSGRFQSVKHVMQDCIRQWLLGVVAVRNSRQTRRAS